MKPRLFPPGFYALLVVGVLCLAYGLTGCTPAPELHGRAAFDRWVQEHIVIRHIDTPNEGSWYDVWHNTLFINDYQVNAYATVELSYAEWLIIHEESHPVGVKLGLFIGDEKPHVHEIWAPAERGAQCIAEVVLGHGPPMDVGDDTEPGFWDCPATWVDRTRLAMIQGGMW